MGDVIAINQKRIFTVDDAHEILPVIRRLTASTKSDVANLVTQMNYARTSERKADLENEIRSYVQEWYQKIRMLGGESKGMWLVDFDNGDGYYCWHHPETEILYTHGYAEGFQGRVKIH